MYLSAPTPSPELAPGADIPPVNPLKQLDLANKDRKKHRKKQELTITPPPKSESSNQSPVGKPLHRIRKKARSESFALPTESDEEPLVKRAAGIGIPADMPAEAQLDGPPAKRIVPWIEIPADMPAEAQPTEPRTGRLSYTLSAANGARIEVLLKGKAFRVNKAVPGFPEEPKQKAWSVGIEAAWEWAKEVSGYVPTTAVESEDIN